MNFSFILFWLVFQLFQRIKRVPKKKRFTKAKKSAWNCKFCIIFITFAHISDFAFCFFNWFYIGNHAQFAHTYKNTHSGVKTLWKLFRGRFYCNFEQFENEWQAMEMHINRKFNAFTTSTAQTLNGSQMKWLFRNIWLCIR